MHPTLAALRRAVLLCLLAPSTLAGTCVPHADRTDVDTGETLLGRYYVIADFVGCDECLTTLWVYEETNGIDGLQRNDDAVDSTCGGTIPSDTLVP